MDEDTTEPTGDHAPEDATGGDGQQPPAQPDGGEKPSEPTFTQADIDRIVKERLDREKAKADAKAKKAAEEAEAKALADQEKFKELAEKRAGKIAQYEADLEAKAGELETTAEHLERYKAALTAQLETAKADLPEPTLELLNRLDPVEQLEYLTKHGSAVAPRPNGVPPSPKPAHKSEPTKKEQQPVRINF